MTLCSLTKKTCEPCRGGVPPLTGDALAKLEQELDDRWSVVDGHHLERVFTFDDFRQALAFTNQVGELAEAENHHPEITLTWGRVTVTIWTHKVDGLTENDFILAAKTSLLCGATASADMK